jgi:fused signal recognition particle receptor
LDWQLLMAAFEKWLWNAPYLDIPNYSWMAAGLGVLVSLLYLIMVLTTPEEEIKEDETKKEPEKEKSTPSKTREKETAQPKPEVLPEEEKEPPPPEKLQKEEAVLPEPEKEPPSEEVEAPPPEEVPPKEEIELEPPEGFFSRLKDGLNKTQQKFSKGLTKLLYQRAIDDDLIEDLEELLITSDIGVKTSMKLLEKLEEEVDKEAMKDTDQLKDWLKSEIKGILSNVDDPLIIPEGHKGPYVIMVTGVNGTGKTTTIGKLAMKFNKEGKTVLLGAADTFRAAAIEQLEIWAERSECKVVKHQEGADPSAVAFDSIHAAKARDVDVLIIDTAGRLHTKVNLMEELKKVKRIAGRELEGAPHEILLVLDSTTGQNAVLQAKTFNETLGVTGLVLTKLDGTAKGGIIVAISDEFGIPIRYIGVGEKIYDLQVFKSGDFVDALF